MIRFFFFLSFLFLLWHQPTSVEAQRARKSATPYYPGPDPDWQHKTPAEVGMNAAQLQQAIDFAIAHDNPAPRDMKLAQVQSFGKEPFGEGIGPFKERGEPTGVVVRHGYVVAEWGEPLRVDMTHSVTKSFLSSVVGVAVDRGMIRSVRDTVRPYVAPVQVYQPVRLTSPADGVDAPDLLLPFETPHNRTITWDDLLRQTSDWEGTLWGKPDWADRPDKDATTWRTRARQAPGTTYKYNDVRVNVLALAALSVWRRPLPQVLKETIMDPIGASPTWRWWGYENSWVVLDGQLIQSVSGGGHWGGGMFIHAYDMARFGYLTLRRGRWNGQPLLSDDWVQLATTPTQPQPTYGFMNWFLNTDRTFIPSAPASAFAHVGNGTNMVYVDPEHDLVVVMRWIENGSIDEFIRQVLASIEK
ncbi:serine hydrolase domain-containing protein [Catalinimonas alkaloidigena]|nr:serine hydrolase [Catalinimonas alkaloidigena]